MSQCRKCLHEKPDSLFVTIKGKRVGMVCRVCRSAQIVEGRRNREDVEKRLADRSALVSSHHARCGKCGGIKPDSLFPQKDGRRHGSVCKDCTAGLKKIWRSLTEQGAGSKQRAEKRKERDEQKKRDSAARIAVKSNALRPESKTVCAICDVEKVNTEFLIVGGRRHGRRCLECATRATKEFREKRLSDAPDLHRALRSHEATRRRAGVAKRIPAWADIRAIEAFYKKRPKGHHVDHVIPLFGKLVSGLHVENNLQYLTAKENMKKNRAFIP